MTDTRKQVGAGSVLTIPGYGQEEIRVRCYQLATVLVPRLVHPPVPVEEAAERFAKFVGDQKWKFRALEIAVAEKRHETTLDYCIGKATEAVEFAEVGEKEVLTTSSVTQALRQNTKRIKKSRTRKR